MRSLHTRLWSLGHRLVVLVFCVGLLVLLSANGSAQQAPTVKVTPKPNPIADAAKPGQVTLSITDNNNNALTPADATAFSNLVRFVKVGNTDVTFQFDTAKNNLTFPAPPNLSGAQTVLVQDAQQKTLAQTELQYPAAPAQGSQTGTPEAKSENKYGDLAKAIWSVAYKLLIGGLLIFLLVNSNLTINHVIRFSRSSFRNALGFPVGSFRALLAYTLVAYLGIYVVASVVGISDIKPPDSILGIVATVIGFYFGTRSGDEGEGSGPAGTVRGVVRVGDKPARGATVKFKRVDNGTEPYTRVTTIEGNFEPVRAKPGKYTVSATLTGLPPATVNIDVAEDSDQEIEIVIKEQTAPTTGTVEVTVKTVDGKPVEGAKVVLTQGTITQNGTTDKDGKFTFKNIPAGECKIVATLDTKTADTKVTGVPGQTTPATIQFPA